MAKSVGIITLHILWHAGLIRRSFDFVKEREKPIRNIILTVHTDVGQYERVSFSRRLTISIRLKTFSNSKLADSMIN